jgi:hypothetical protein
MMGKLDKGLAQRGILARVVRWPGRVHAPVRRAESPPQLLRLV